MRERKEPERTTRPEKKKSIQHSKQKAIENWKTSTSLEVRYYDGDDEGCDEQEEEDIEKEGYHLEIKKNGRGIGIKITRHEGCKEYPVQSRDHTCHCPL